MTKLILMVNITPGLNIFFFSDLNKNEKSEIIGFTMQNDSLLLNIAEPFGKPAFQKKYFVTKIKKARNGSYDPSILGGFSEDIDKNSETEFIFSLGEGYSMLPKCIYSFSLSTGQFRRTPIVGNNNVFIQPFLNPKANNYEIIADGNAGYVLPDTLDVYLKDDRPYLKVYNSNLDFKFNPVPFPVGITSYSKTIPAIENDNLFYYSYYFSKSAESPPPTVYKINHRGEKTDSLVIPVDQRVGGIIYEKNKAGNFYVLCERGKVYEVNLQLEIVNEIKIKNNGNFGLYAKADINEDQIPEYFLIDGDDQKLYVATDNFKRFYAVGKDLFVNPDPKIKKNQFYTYDKNLTYTYSYSLNPYRYLAITVYIFIYLIFAGIVWSVRKTQETRVKERYKLQSQVRELQLKTFRNQINPHFIFNTLNSVISANMQERKEEAHNLFIKITNVLRQSLENTESILISLENELKLVKNFVAIQQFRFKNVFEFELNIDNKIDASKLLIPKMIIQIHVENAIKHGLRPKRKNGKLTIDIQKEKNKTVKITIEDNGIGREEAQKTGTGGTNLGLKTMTHFIKEINSVGKINVTQKIVDLKDSFDNPAGTKIILKIKRLKSENYSF